MKITILGGGPSGLYFAILMKQADPSRQISIYERDAPGDTFGWGIVFSDQTFGYLENNDGPTYREIVARCRTWDDVVIVHRGEEVRIGGNSFSGIARVEFLDVLQRRCAELDIDLHFRTIIDKVSDLPAADLIVGADGANSLVRRTYPAQFEPQVSAGGNKYIWLGTNRLFNGLTLIFRMDEAGLFIAHAYAFSDTTSTFIVECTEETWRNAGLADKDEAETCRYLERVFADDLQEQPLLSNNFVRWLNFPLVRNGHWHHDNVVLLGDALHTAHFSIGSGTKLALEDAIALNASFRDSASAEQALIGFERDRRPRVDRLQEASEQSRVWFETAVKHVDCDPLEFAYRAMTRSGVIDREKLRERDPAFVALYERRRG